MDQQRRKLLTTGSGMALFGGLLAAGLVRPGAAWAASDWNNAAFDTKSIADTVKALGGNVAGESQGIAISAPDIAENGAVVPVGITSSLPNTESIAILVEKNPNALAASFDIPAGTEPTVSTRVKMGQSSNITALVKADGKFYLASKEIKVTLGGCGG